ncbi:hypothetical protein A1Q1_06487 [Trichosporon asahii var. asahii CBS 2479]|uniref:ERCC1-like central domain-containing protein n=1 Tax=Trichosporon asahii var. asahii (strain ATCC 90039 / CBS 2479 / JCM 2466 / KCTC 7840 / NBRC 103889/ NCYC 2677 / UAMH 7654) TaxID=1186058 RepID=J4U5D4_TRIAS|nr:hypothetical protein A1Q1_06487 [Trichosporon asahii var. asahii CBS 2479]EJT45170.1 hypothetical protein A1Q1_06487 [Trichosporon asahii var. asahii CBS 2479]
MDPPETTTQQETGKGGGSTGSSFQSALTALKSTHQPSLSSNRNAGGGLPPVPKAWANDFRTEGENSVASSKPVNRPASSKNAIVHSVLQYHRLHPEYIHSRIEKMRNAYNVRILLILCDIQYEHKSADPIKERVHQTYHNQLDHVLTSGRKVNKSNVEALAAQFGSFSAIATQSNHALGTVKGLGPKKVVSLLDAFNKPFVASGKPHALDVPAASATEIAEPEPEAELDNLPPTPPTPSRPRDEGPSRSPSVGPDDDREATGAVWDDPLSDDDDDKDERASKRQRM